MSVYVTDFVFFICAENKERLLNLKDINKTKSSFEKLTYYVKQCTIKEYY